MSDAAQRLRLYGRRKGKPLKPSQERLMADLFPRLRVVPPDAGAGLDPAALFGEPRDALWFEIGFGAGEHLAAQAAAHPAVGIIGCEPFINGVASLLRHIDADGLANVRIYDGDARALLDALPDACLDRLFILFPDPWPKKRHWKRRFINRENLDRLARVLRDGGELRFASDHGGYVDWALNHITADPRFQWLARDPADWRRRPDDAPATRYEAKAAREGRQSAYLRFARRSR